jgi:hypothetical protein
MWEFQKPLPGAAPGAKWLPAARIYALSEQPQVSENRQAARPGRDEVLDR